MLQAIDEATLTVVTAGAVIVLTARACTLLVRITNNDSTILDSLFNTAVMGKSRVGGLLSFLICI